MSRAVLRNAALDGSIRIPCSKSDAHRAEICTFLAGGAAEQSLAESDDIRATRLALEALGKGGGTIDCGESGSTLRFLIPVAAALGKAVTFTGEGRLPQRPIGEYLRLLPAHGVQCESEGGLPLTISGQLKAGQYALAGNVSSQYITGLLLALPLLEGDSEIVLTTELQSKPYVEMTLRTMARFGVTVNETDFGYQIRGGQTYRMTDYAIEGDWSQAAFFLVGGALTGEVTLNGLDSRSAQGDKQIVNVLRRFGADITQTENGVSVKRSRLRGIELDVSDIPDMVPAIAVAAAFAEGKTVITGGERLRVKESDRIHSVVANLKKMGVTAQETPDGMVIHGGGAKGAVLSGYNDHRIVMAFSIAALAAEGETEISDALSINKSYPAFFEDYNALGGKADVICDRQ